MYEQALIEQVQSNITGSITVTPSEVNQFVSKISPDSMPMVSTTYQFGEIVKIPPVSEEEVASVKERLMNYRERVLRGERFGALARPTPTTQGAPRKAATSAS